MVYQFDKHSAERKVLCTFCKHSKPDTVPVSTIRFERKVGTIRRRMLRDMSRGAAVYQCNPLKLLVSQLQHDAT